MAGRRVAAMAGGCRVRTCRASRRIRPVRAVGRQPSGRESRCDRASARDSSVARRADGVGPRRSWSCAVHVVCVFTFFAFVMTAGWCLAGSSRTWRCASPGTASYASTDNVVKSDRRSCSTRAFAWKFPDQRAAADGRASTVRIAPRRSLQIDLEPVAWPAIPRVALALLPQTPLRRRTADPTGTPSQAQRRDRAVREPRRRIMNRTPRPGAPPRAVPDTKRAPRRRRAAHLGGRRHSRRRPCSSRVP